MDDTRGDADGHHGCGCEPQAEGAGHHGGATASTACACAGVEKVVRRTHRLSAWDALKVGAFVALLAVLVLALWR